MFIVASMANTNFHVLSMTKSFCCIWCLSYPYIPFHIGANPTLFMLSAYKSLFIYTHIHTQTHKKASMSTYYSLYNTDYKCNGPIVDNRAFTNDSTILRYKVSTLSYMSSRTWTGSFYLLACRSRVCTKSLSTCVCVSAHENESIYLY